MNQDSVPILHPPLLVATDGSASARMAQQLLYPIAPILAEDEQNAPLIRLITVVPRSRRRSSVEAARVASETPTSVVTAEPAPPEQLLGALQADVPTALTVRTVVRQGRPAVEILNYARSERAGLIAVGHRGIGGMQELLLGSVSTVIARYAPCSVLIARSIETAVTAPTWDHVLLVVDQAMATRCAIRALQQLLPAGIQNLTAVCVQPPVARNYLYGPLFTPTPSWQLNQSLNEVQREEGEQLLQQVKLALAQQAIRVETQWHVGEVGPTLCQIAQQLQVNVIVTGSDASRRSLLNPLASLRKSASSNQSRPLLRNTRLTPTEDYLIHHAPCAVLLCRQSSMG